VVAIISMSFDNFLAQYFKNCIFKEVQLNLLIFMLIFGKTKFIKSPFLSEAELENVVIENYEYIFGPSSIYLPKTKIKTADGGGTIPDGFAIDLELRRWYLVEAELMHHSVWNHIAPQVTKQILASNQSSTKRILIDLTVDQYRLNNNTKEKFQELNIDEINVRQIVADILESEPIIGIPIDGITNDLKEWARTLRYKVKLWVINKYIEFSNTNNVIFEFPEEFNPELETEENSKSVSENNFKRQSNTRVEIYDLMKAGLLAEHEELYMNYGFENQPKKNYKAIIKDDGSLHVLGRTYSSPSYAAVACINDSGSRRNTENGWRVWRNSTGKVLNELRDEYFKITKTE